MNLTNIPLASVWWSDMPNVCFAFEIVGFAIMFLITLMTAKMVRDVVVYIQDDFIRADLFWLLGSPFFVGSCCTFGNIFPRSSGILYAIGLTYLMVCLYRAVDLVYKLFGGRDKFAKWLQRHNRRVVLATPPLCCCCKCLPEAEPTQVNLQRLKLLVEQSPFVRILIQIVLVVMALEKIPEASAWNQVLNGIGVASTLIGVYITHVMLNLTKEYLQQFGMVVLFRCVDVSQMLFTVLKFIFDLISKNGKFGRYPIMSSEGVGNFWFNVSELFACLLLCSLHFYFIRPGKCALFDTTIVGRTATIMRRNDRKGAVPTVETPTDEAYGVQSTV